MIKKIIALIIIYQIIFTSILLISLVPQHAFGQQLVPDVELRDYRKIKLTFI